MVKVNGSIKLSKHDEDAYRRVVNCGMGTPAQRYHVKTMMDRIDHMLLSAPLRHKNGIPIVTQSGEVLEVRQA